ncbi:MAG: type II toxin-antitoxin system RelE/ParE family toxin [Bacillota bacterium]|nr:type II toxin-antitoxin system RelE/ParE family toxin [Bacillota bacterium]
MYQLMISPEARNDLAEIISYISQELCNPQAAINLVSSITKKIRRLSDHPGMGTPLSSAVDIQTDYRFLVCGHYLIFYRYESEIIYVSRVLYGRRDYTRILFGDFPEVQKENNPR